MNQVFAASALAALSTVTITEQLVAQDIPPYVKPDNPGPERFAKRVLASGLDGPWEVTYGPDSQLWVVERAAKRVLRIDPDTGTQKVALTIDEAYTGSTQDGLLGMALHPELLQGTGQDYVYVAFTYATGAADAVIRKVKLQRYTYDKATQTLAEPLDLIDGLPGSRDHNSGRMLVGPDNKLYYTIGDQGKNQLSYYCLDNQAQRLPTQAELDANIYWAYQGKVLRLSLDGSIPDDNPRLDGVRSHIFSYGHRNVQGLAFGPDGTFYASEHGPKSDDELNVLTSGKNYGWPHINGYRDDAAYRYYRWYQASPLRCESLTFSNYVVPEDVPSAAETDFSHDDFTPPFLTFYTVPNDHDFLTGPGCDGTSSCSPTIAPGGLDIYTQAAIPGWADSLLIPSLKEGALFRVKLSEPGVAEGRAEEAYSYFDTENRYRDLAISADGQKLYIATDPSGNTVGPDGPYITELEDPGAILEFRYLGPRAE
jgi:PQQ-dependent dehydrogenase (s-GDH family)